jgi:flagellar biosynthesis/type III secretory pathway protein FliH
MSLHLSKSKTLKQIIASLDQDLQDLVDLAIVESRKDGYQEGYEKGKEEGYNNGYDSGHDDGLAEGIEQEKARWKAKEKVTFT